MKLRLKVVRMRHIRPGLLLAAVVCALTLGACGGGSKDAAATAAQGSPAGGTKAAGQSTDTPLRIAVTSIVPDVDPSSFYGLPSAWLSQPVASPLMRYEPVQENGALTPSNKVVGDLAQDFKVRDGGSIEVTLRDAKSPAGNTVSSADVMWTFKRQIATARVGGFLANLSNIDLKHPIQRINAKKFVIRVKHPSEILKGVLAENFLAILDSKEAKKHATAKDPWASKWLKTHSATFGPYEYAQFKPAAQITLKANPNYWAGEPKYRNAIITQVPDAGSRLQLLRTGEVDFVNDLPYSLVKRVANNDVAVSTSPSVDQDFLVLNLKKKPFDDADVRKAVSLALDRTEIAQAVYQGFAKPSGDLLPVVGKAPRSNPAFPPTAHVDEAKKLLAKAGHPNGIQFALYSNSAIAPGSYADALSALVQSQLAKAGIKVTLNNVASASEFYAQKDAKYPAYFLSNKQLLVDPAYALSLNWSSISTSPNKYVTPALDKAETTMLTTAAGPERDAAIEQAAQILNTAVPTVPIVDLKVAWAYRKGLGGFSAIPPLEWPYLQYVTPPAS